MWKYSNQTRKKQECAKDYSIASSPTGEPEREVEPGLRTGFFQRTSDQPVQRPGSTMRCRPFWSGDRCNCMNPTKADRSDAFHLQQRVKAFSEPAWC